MVEESMKNACLMTAKTKGGMSVGKNDVNSRQFLNLPAMKSPLMSKKRLHSCCKGLLVPLISRVTPSCDSGYKKRELG